MDENNMILVEYFHSNGHDLSIYTTFIIIEIIEKDINLKSIIEKKKKTNE